MQSPAIAKNYLVQFGSRVIAVTLGLITLALMTRALGDTGFGEFTTAVTYLQIVTVLADLGLTLVFIQMISVPDADEDRIASAFLGLRLFSNALAFAIAIGLAFLTPYNTIIQLAIAVGAIGYLSLSTTGMLTGFFQKHLAMWRASLAEVVNRVLTLVLVILAVQAELGVIAFVAILTISNLVHLFMLILFAQPLARMRPTIDLHIWKTAVSTSWPIGLSIFFNLLYLKSDVMILGLFFPQSEVGIYGASYRVLDVFTALPVMYMGLILPQLVATWTKRLVHEFNRYLQQTFDFFLIVVLPLLFGTPFVAVPLMKLVAGEEFERSGAVLPILMLAMLPIFTGAMTGHAIVALNKQRVMLWGYGATAVVALVGYVLLIPIFGIVGAAWMTVVSEVLINTLTAIVVMKTSGWRPNLTIFSKALTASVLMALLILALPSLPVLLTILIAIIFYAGAIMAFGGVKLSSLKKMIS